MTYFELLNKVLLELGLNTLENFENAYKNEHFRILDAIKTANENICRICDWEFLKKREEKTLEIGTKSVEFEDLERVISIKINGKFLCYDKGFIKNFFKPIGTNFWGYKGFGKIEFSPVREKSKLEIVYLSNNFAIDENGLYKPNFEFATDKSVLPEIAKNVLVYETCLLTKPPTTPKYSVWEREHLRGIKNMFRANSVCEQTDPAIRLEKGFR